MDRVYIWTNIPIKDHLIKLISSIVLRGEDGVFQEELVWHIALIYARIKASMLFWGRCILGGRDKDLSGGRCEPAPTFKSHRAKELLSGVLSKCMFFVRCKTSTYFHSLDLCREALMICALEPLGTTGKVCLKSPTNMKVISPNNETWFISWPLILKRSLSVLRL